MPDDELSYQDVHDRQTAIDMLVLREWLFFLFWFCVGLFVIPFFLVSVGISIDLDRHYSQVLAGNLLPWLAFLLPYSAFLLVRLFL